MPRRQEGEDWEHYAIRIGVIPTPESIRGLIEEEAVRSVGLQAQQMPPQPPIVPQNINPGMLRSMEWPTTSTRLPGGFVIGGFDEIEEAPIQESAIKPFTSERESALYKALDLIQSERHNYTPERPSMVGRREGQYHTLILNQKKESMTVAEIVHSEIPIPVAQMNSRRLREIAYLSRHRDIRGDGDKSRLQFVCAKCNGDTPHQFAFFCIGRIYCAEHLPDLEMCRSCGELAENCKKITTFDNREIMVCPHCTKRNRNCARCSNPLDIKFVELRMCQTCIDNGDTRTPHRGFSHGVKWLSKDKGDIIKSSRMFSTEIEALSPLNEWGYHLCKILPKEMGITTDGSVQSKTERLYGFEVQTPKLSGRKGEELVARMAAGLKEVRATINETCGMHIHLDGKGVMPTSRKEYPASLIQLIKTYVVFEDVMMSFLPYSRRRNDYCRPLAETFQLAEIETLETVVDIEKLWYKGRTSQDIASAKGHNYHASRYFGTNLSSLLNQGHLEIRFHSGTTMPKKILEWANLHALIMDACANRVFNSDFLREAQSTSRLSEKTKLLYDAIGLAEPSRQYFRARQKKFGDKKNEDDELRKSKPGKVPTPPQRRVISLQQMVDEQIRNTRPSQIFSNPNLEN